MIVTSDFFDHWKTKALIELSGRPEAPLWLMRLWAHCYNTKATRFKLPDIALKSICNVPHEITAEQWLTWLTTCRFIDGKSGDWTVHDWEHHNSGLVSRWKNGRRPKRKRTESGAQAAAMRSTGSVRDGLEGLEGRDGVEGNTPKPLRSARPVTSVGILATEQPEPVQGRMLAVAALKHRQPGTRWSAKEIAAFRAAGLHAMSDADFDEQIQPLAAYYAAPVENLSEHWRSSPGDDFRRRDLQTLLNNWPSEVDRSRAWQHWAAKKSDECAVGRL